MPSTLHNQKILKERRIELRNTATKEERILWNHIKSSKLGYKFRRQESIGPYIVDFFCPEYNVVIELDGSQHLDNKEYDLERDSFLKLKGYTIIRFWNNDIHKNLDGVIMKIQEILSNTTQRFSK